LRGAHIALLGLTFKPHTDDLREAASIVLAARLRGEGAKVTAHDPMLSPGSHELFPGVDLFAEPLEAVRDADALVVVTEWPEFLRLDWAAVKKAMRRPVVIDGRNVLDPDALREAGFTYEGVGVAGLPEAVRSGSS
jgi:UDPglucose 6-dehydrogenase